MTEEQARLKSEESPPSYDEPPPAYPGPPQQVIVTGQPTVVLQHLLQEDPIPIKCPLCGVDVITQVQFENGTATYLASGLMCLVGLWLGCCLIPFCINAAKDAVHTCPSCRRVIGRYTRM